MGEGYGVMLGRQKLRSNWPISGEAEAPRLNNNQIDYQIRGRDMFIGFCIPGGEPNATTHQNSNLSLSMSPSGIPITRQ